MQEICMWWRRACLSLGTKMIEDVERTIYKRFFLGSGERWLSSLERLLLFQKIWVQFPAPTGSLQLGTPVPEIQHPLLASIGTRHTFIHADKTLIQNKNKSFLKLFFKNSHLFWERVYLCSPEGPWMDNSLASASQLLALQACTTSSNWQKVLDLFLTECLLYSK